MNLAVGREIQTTYLSLLKNPTFLLTYVDNSKLHQMTSQEQQTLLSYKNWKSREFDFIFMGQYSQKASYADRYALGKFLQSTLLHQNGSSPRMGHDFGPMKFLYATTIQNCKNCNATQLQEYPKFDSCDESLCMENKNCANCLLTANQQKNYTNFLINSKFSLIIHGDTPSTSRLYDSISSGCLPIVISSELYEQGLPFTSKVNYLDFMFFIPHTLPVDKIYQNLLRIVKFTPEYIWQHKFETMKSYLQDVSWRHLESRVIDNILYDAVHTCRV